MTLINTKLNLLDKICLSLATALGTVSGSIKKNPGKNYFILNGRNGPETTKIYLPPDQHLGTTEAGGDQPKQLPEVRPPTFK